MSETKPRTWKDKIREAAEMAVKVAEISRESLLEDRFRNVEISLSSILGPEPTPPGVKVLDKQLINHELARIWNNRENNADGLHQIATWIGNTYGAIRPAADRVVAWLRDEWRVNIARQNHATRQDVGAQLDLSMEKQGDVSAAQQRIKELESQLANERAGNAAELNRWKKEANHLHQVNAALRAEPKLNPILLSPVEKKELLEAAERAVWPNAQTPGGLLSKGNEKFLEAILSKLGTPASPSPAPDHHGTAELNASQQYDNDIPRAEPVNMDYIYRLIAWMRAEWRSDLDKGDIGVRQYVADQLEKSIEKQGENLRREWRSDMRRVILAGCDSREWSRWKAVVDCELGDGEEKEVKS